MDGRTRPLHALWHGTILPVDHPWWLTHFPPNGWRCRCTVVQLNARMMERRGWTVSNTPPEGPVRPFWRKGAKEPVFVPAGIDPGFGYNPGIARNQALAEKAAQTLADAQAAGLGDAALDEIAGPTTPQTRNSLLSLIAAGALGELGQRLGALLFGGEATAATLAGDDLETAARKRRAKGGGAAGGRSRATGGRPDQKRDGGGRFVEEGKRERGRRETVEVWFDDTVKVGAMDNGKLYVGKVSERTAARIEALGIPVKQRAVLLDHGASRHIYRNHGSTSERDRGQEPITGADLSRAPAIYDAANFKVSTDRRGNHEGSAPLLEFEDAALGGHRYGGLVNVINRGLIVRDIWKRKL
jgi:hypothetical protein